ncbi:MAG TPA: class I SAM-dependent rRNA methyltransferase [Thermoanaerobaculia bacterium]|nr:class I SAM-dependent rRNA methyltransferase [Thermoanaerobaculia bacterium]
MSSTARVFLEPGHVKPVWAGHPWVYAQAIAHVEGSPTAGDVVEVRDRQGNLLGRGFWSPGSAIPVRLVTRDADETLDEAALARRIAAAVVLRERVLGLPSTAPAHGTDGFRLVHSEGDDLPGVVADRYGDTVCVQLLTAGMKRREEAIFDAFAALPGIHRVVEVPGGEGQKREGIATTLRTVRGEPADALAFRERGFAFEVPLALMQKTGYYFDQRENRARVEALARDARVLDVCTYLGGFALAAARGGAASVVGVDRAAPLLQAAAAVAARNGIGDRITWRQGDARRDLAAWAAAGERWDLVVLDPPKLAPTAKHLQQALTAYEGLNAAALRLVAPGGVLATCSCSAAFGPEELLRVVAASARRAHRQTRLLAMGHQAADHPTPPAFAQGRYLTCAFVAVD